MFGRHRHSRGFGSWASLYCGGLAIACSGSGSPGVGGAGNAAGRASATAGASAGTPPTSGSGAGSTGMTAGGASSGGQGGTAATGAGASSSGSAGELNPGAGKGNAGAGGTAAASGGASDGGRAGGVDAGGLSGAGAQAGSTGAQWSGTFPTFTPHTIASFSSGYTTVIADMDHDGMPDVVALSSGSAGLVWFKNPSWTKYTITMAKQLIHCAPYDVDGDGDLDLAIARDFDMNDTTSGGTVSWAENPDDPTQNQDWALHDVGSVPTSHRVRFGDIDGDGKKELLVLPIFGVGSDPTTRAGAVALTAFTIPADPTGKWTSRVLDDQNLEVAHGIAVVDWDGDQAADILTAANDGVDLFRPSLGGTVEHMGMGASGQAPNKGSSEVGLGSLGGARFIATIEPWHGTDGVIYTPCANDSSLCTRNVLGADFEHGHGLMVADFNGDGFDEVVAGGGQGMLTQLIYRYVPSTQKWDKLELDIGGVAVSGIDVQDLNADGAPDIVSIGGSPTNNVVWYENTR